ncbi:poly-beta-hydroxybutyrate-responsive repressor [Alicyclobacillaceae bacterium I2511]|nr:poly-beta-hydroxybutyrate-responsive repressor [Alicyclobacillaceae bacterium I2511]
MMVNEHDALGKAPKNFLVPYILLILREVPVHGYELIQRLTVLGFPGVDRGNVYRMLRQLEQDHYVQSTWSTASAGPAKREYSLTESGEAYLHIYADELERYQSMLSQFFRMYGSFVQLYNPFFGTPADSPENPEKKSIRRNDEDDPT